jgi:hypothetical protein
LNLLSSLWAREAENKSLAHSD